MLCISPDIGGILIVNIYYVMSSNADNPMGWGFRIDYRGRILSSHVTAEFGTIPTRFDTREFIDRYGGLTKNIDILDLGYWIGDIYEKPASDWRELVGRKGIV